MVRDNGLFWSKVNKTDGCWLWTASTNGGYGQIKIGGRKGRLFLAHRYAWLITHGEIPTGTGYHGTCVLHKCDNRLCVNPDHLFLGSQSENLADMKTKGRASRVPKTWGARNNKTKLTEEQVRDIRAATDSQRDCAARYGVVQSTIGTIRRRQHWQHVA